ncbi:MAG: serine/threonine protein kinase [Fusobacteriaceae bacterium]
MKKYILLFSIFLKIILVAQEIPKKGYDYPYEDPYVATIVGSSTLMMKGVSDKIPVENYVLDNYTQKKLPESLWYQKGFKYSLVKQKEKAPLIFIIAGTGATYNSKRMTYFQRILYDAGYNVISITSPVNMNFILNASTEGLPSLLKNDSEDIYKVMTEAYSQVKDKIQVSDFYIMGYSLGAAQAAYVSYIDEQEKKFQFKRVYMMNPPVDMYKSGVKLDKLLDENIGNDKKNIEKLLDEVFEEISKQTRGANIELSETTIYSLFTNKILSEEKMKSLIGLAFRISSVDLNYVTDLISGAGNYVKAPVGKYESIFKYFENINFANFQDYLEKIALPHYMKKGVGKEEILEGVKINIIEDYLRNSKKIAVVTNADDLILDKEDLNYLKSVFGERIIIFPKGGHSGNMYYGPNVKTMLDYLENGVLNYEN